MKKYVISMMVALAALGTWAAKAPPPEKLAAKMAEQLFRTKPEVYKPIGCDTDRPWYGGGKMMYCVVATWVNALECARATRNRQLEDRLLDLYPRIVLPETKAIPEPDSVDNSLFGALPLEVAILCGNNEARRLGFRFADAQWDQPLNKVLRRWAMPSPEEQKRLVAAGYSTQTRFWIDDMYMITALQVQAARASKGKARLKYLNRAAHQMHLYVEKLQRDDGLFNHSFNTPIAWGRGNGWMAAGMTMLLGDLPQNHPERGYLLAAYRRFAAALERWQRPNGLWGQIVDDKESWDESSGSAMFAYMFAQGMHKWLIEWGYLDKAKKAYEALAAKVDEHGNLADVCEGTDAKNDREHYMNRPRVNGAPYGQAAMQLLCQALYLESRAKPRKVKWRQLTPMARAKAGEVASVGEFRLESTYSCISVAWGAPKPFKGGVEMEYRKSGTAKWNLALAPEFFPPNNNYRGSIVNLEEDTEYEVRIVADGKEAVSGKVRTWKTDVPVAKTIEIDPATATFPIKIRDRGSADGWIRYVPKGGEELVNDTSEVTFDIAECSYVILDGFRIRGGKGKASISLNNCRGVRILNCELYGWGPGGPPRWDGRARGLCYEGNMNVQCGAISLGYKPSEVTIERCFIHSPRGRAHSWRYSHPYGPAAVRTTRPNSAVIRWCDFVGCDSRRFEDCIKSSNNKGYDTGLGRNSDVYGCFLFGANDDGIELDGSQQNVRFFDNRVEDVLMGVSVQFCQTSPSYVFNNSFTGLGSEFGHKISAVKTSAIDNFHSGSVSYIMHNTFCGPGWWAALDMSANADTARLRAYNNLFVGKEQRFVGTNRVVRAKFAGNVETVDQGVLVSGEKGNVSPTAPRRVKAIVNFSRNASADGSAVAGALAKATKAVTLPSRPVPWALDTGRIAVSFKDGRLSQESATFTLACGGRGYRRPFKIRTCDLDTGWFDVEPKEGVIKSGSKIDFKVTFKPEALKKRRQYAAAFLVRTDDGFARPVSLHAQTDFVAPFKVENPRDIVVYGKKENEKTWTFEVPKAGTYYFFVRGSNPTTSGNAFTPSENKIVAVIRDSTRPAAFPQLKKWSTWAPLCPGGYNICGFELPEGTQLLEIIEKSDTLAIEGFAIAREPMDMEGQVRED